MHKTLFVTSWRAGPLASQRLAFRAGPIGANERWARALGAKLRTDTCCGLALAPDGPAHQWASWASSARGLGGQPAERNER